MTRLLGSKAAWAVLLVTVVVLLVVGSQGGPSSAAAGRIAHLDSLIKCPACEDLSIAQSDAPSSVTLRHEVAAWVHAGWSDSRIEQAVVDRYGPGGLLLPQGTGAARLLYIVPVSAIAAAAATLFWHLWRRRLRLRAGSGGTAV
jgi:cytochrome c-type biogenesis protein CcmH/NrfF